MSDTPTRKILENYYRLSMLKKSMNINAKYSYNDRKLISLLINSVDCASCRFFHWNPNNSLKTVTRHSKIF